MTMKRNLYFVSFILTIFFEPALAQSTDYLTTREQFFTGYRIKQGNDFLTRKQVREIMAVDPSALETFKLASSYKTTAEIIASAGGAIILIMLLTQMPDYNFPSLVLPTAGFSLLTTGYTFAFRNKDREAIDLYNFRNCSGKVQPTFHVKLSPTASGIVLKF